MAISRDRVRDFLLSMYVEDELDAEDLETIKEVCDELLESVGLHVVA